MNGTKRPSPKRTSSLPRTWQSWQDDIVRALPPEAAARRVGRPLPDVLDRIRRLTKSCR